MNKMKLWRRTRRGHTHERHEADFAELRTIIKFKIDKNLKT